MISTAASSVRPDADLPDNRPGRWLAALALGLAALLVLVFAPAQAVVSAGQPVRTAAVAMTAAAAPAQVERLHHVDRSATAVAAPDIEAPADPALPAPLAEAEAARVVVATPFPEMVSPCPAPAPAGSPLRPPRRA